MKGSIQVVALVLWIALASMLLTRLWLIQPELFPAFPKPVAEYLAALYGAQNAEDVADLEILVGLSISALVVSALTFLSLTIWRKKR